jgi:putative aminopeptidase FrvX
MNKGLALLERLSLCFGPTSCEVAVEQAIREELAGTKAELFTDRMGNLTAHLPGAVGAPRVMLSAHMDEVGFMITEIDADGFLRSEMSAKRSNGHNQFHNGYLPFFIFGAKISG